MFYSQFVLREIGIRLQFGLRLQLFWETSEHFVEAQAYRIAYCAFRVSYSVASHIQPRRLIDPLPIFAQTPKLGMYETLEVIMMMI